MVIGEDELDAAPGLPPLNWLPIDASIVVEPVLEPAAEPDADPDAASPQPVRSRASAAVAPSAGTAMCRFMITSSWSVNGSRPDRPGRCGAPVDRSDRRRGGAGVCAELVSGGLP